jgi:hypothetical protein
VRPAFEQHLPCLVDDRDVPGVLGLKENIIIGHPIPAGSGVYRYAEIDIQPPAGYEAPPPRVEEPVPAPALTAAAMLGGGVGLRIK